MQSAPDPTEVSTVARQHEDRGDELAPDPSYLDAHGELREVDPEVLEQLRALVEVPEDAPAPVVLRRGRDTAAPLAEGVIELEAGGEVPAAGATADSLPLGYHRLHVAGRSSRLIVAPAACHLPAARAWGWSVQLYAARSRSSWGMGDLGDLRRVAAWGAGQGAGFLLVNPLGATAPVTPQQASPYSPASRRARNPLYLDVAAVPGADQLPDLAALVQEGRALAAGRQIDRDAVWLLKRRSLERIFLLVGPDDGFERWRAGQPAEFDAFATWAVLCERHGPSFRQWPEELRRPDSPAVARVGEEERERARFHLWLQYLVATQLADTSRELPLMHDLPIGVDPGGFDAWVDQDLLAPGVSVGAPPDEFSRDGQDWGLPPYVPWKLRAADYEPFVQTVRAGLQGGGGLRIDHVMGLFRLWWIPPGNSPARGGYVRYPADDLLAVLALESQRSGGVVVGEDLGTVEPGVRETLSEQQVLSYRLLWFEEDHPEHWPATSMAAVTTHDLPTVAGLWDHSDLEVQRAAGLEPNEEGTAEMRDRLHERSELSEDAGPRSAVRAAHQLLAQAPSQLLVATLDDALAEPRRPNVPGGDAATNWSLAAAVDLEELEQEELPRRIAEALGAAVTGDPGPIAVDGGRREG